LFNPDIVVVIYCNIWVEGRSDSMAQKYDVVIVGAGPGGAMAAKTAAENGLKVALLERKTHIAKTYRADGGPGVLNVNEYVFGQIVTYNQKDKRLCFPVGGYTVPYDGPSRNIYGVQVHSPGGKCIYLGDWEEAKRKGDEVRVGISISKENLLEGLLQEAESYGVEVFPGINVTDIKKAGDTVRIESDGKSFEGIFVIAADGINSRIARILGFNKERKFYGTRRDVQWFIEGEIPVDPGSVNFILAEKGNFVINPSYKEDVRVLGTFSFDTKLDLNAIIERFVKEDKTYASWFNKVKKVGLNNCVVNELSPIKEPFKENVFLIGDAAWLREISNMPALCTGWKAAQAVTLAFLDKKYDKEGIASYLKWWEEYFYGPYGGIDLGAGELQDFLSGEEIDYLASLVDKPLPATLNFTTFLGKVGSTYLELFPKIGEERPAIMAKLMEMGSKVDEIREEQRKLGFPNT
jgi:digeranylgeranylglycerophospholipid reductase